MLRHGKRHIALVGRTPADIRDVMIEGESGILACAAPDMVPNYQPTKRRLVWPNGATATTYSAEVGDQLRGPQHDGAWADELAAWDQASKGDVLGSAWNNLMLGLRSKQSGTQNRCVVTTTPRPLKLVRQILDRPTTVVTRATTYDNLGNLSPEFQAQILGTYEGTRTGRQEIYGELLEDVEGALWSLQMIEDSRRTKPPELTRVVVAIDPATTSGDDADETGIVVAGRDADGEGWVLADRTCQLSPDGWATRAVAAYDEFKADRIVGEANNGGDMIESVIRSVRPKIPYTKVHATRGKRIRAEPIAALYEQGKVHHVGPIDAAPPGRSGLETQMLNWVPDSGESPDRLDALVWALTEVMLNHRRGGRMKYRG